ncbi:synapse-associated protein 1-like isoform X1 [Ruditapes philippinarum]|uniref:synapse-associated protein 1-like isoform X1 n=1 Tax=Ruditapes philippinarum TaxID=129788 RepID=UPI00295B2D3E|nr:synapse-associated protein 1-like isoform X1 [Ruditapes philippinarum]
MFKNVSKWLGVVDNTEEEETLAVNAKGEEKVVEHQVKPTDTVQNQNTQESESDTESKKENDLISPETKQTLEEVSAKAISTAKEWGSYLYTFGVHATEKVSEKAKEITKSVEEKTFLHDFNKEQLCFVEEKKERDKKSEAAVPPWVGYNEEDAMKSQILALSQDKRNFLRNPPTGIQFQFDFDSVFPVAMATLQEDPNLQKMRFELVPKQIKEEMFWRNYFYRVSLIKQSTQLTTLAQHSDGKSHGSRESLSSSGKSSPKPIKKQDEEVNEASSPQENEFVSDTFQDDGNISDEDLKKEMQMLGMEDDLKKDEDMKFEKPDVPEWEEELQRELQEYEMVNDGDDIDDPDIENEILKQIEQESSQT